MNKKAFWTVIFLCCFLCCLVACGTQATTPSQETVLSPQESGIVEQAGLAANKEEQTLTEPAAQDGSISQGESPIQEEEPTEAEPSQKKPAQTDENQKVADEEENTSLTTQEQAGAAEEKAVLHCTFSISCKTILDHMDSFDEDKAEVLPEDGVIFAEGEVAFSEGESVFDVLLRETKTNKIHMEFTKTPIYDTNYIEGIHNIYEFDCGELSGWMYRVNGTFPNYGCSRYLLADGDTIEFLYTCDLGRDIGAPQVLGGKQQ